MHSHGFTTFNSKHVETFKRKTCDMNAGTVAGVQQSPIDNTALCQSQARPEIAGRCWLWYHSIFRRCIQVTAGAGLGLPCLAGDLDTTRLAMTKVKDQKL